MKNRRIGQSGEIGRSVGTVATDSRIRGIGESGLTAPDCDSAIISHEAFGTLRLDNDFAEGLQLRVQLLPVYSQSRFFFADSVLVSEPEQLLL